MGIGMDSENEYYCDNCGDFIGTINDCYYITDADLILCHKCHDKLYPNDKEVDPK